MIKTLNYRLKLYILHKFHLLKTNKFTIVQKYVNICQIQIEKNVLKYIRGWGK